MRYETRYVHKISPSEKDIGKPIDLSPTDLESKTKLAAALRRAGIIDGAVDSFRIEKDRVVVFPKGSIWHSILLHRPGTAALPPKKTGPDTYRDFTVRIHPSKSLWFRSSSPVTWKEARDRLIDAGIVKENLAGRTGTPGGWMLSVDESDFSAARAKALP